MKVILLVEDMAVIAMAQSQMLQGFGFKVITVKSGIEAIHKMDEEAKIDLVLMDIDLGEGIDGIESARRILEKNTVPIIFLSSHTDQEIVEKSESITSYGYILKGSEKTVLLVAIKMAFKLFEANQKIEQYSKRLSATLEAIPDLLFELGSDSQIYNFHSPRKGLLYTPKEDFLGKKMTDILPTDASKVVQEAIDEANQKGFSLGKQYEIDVPEGKKWFEISISNQLSIDTETYFITLIRDITNRKQNEKRIAFELRNKEILINSTQDAIWSIDAEFKLTAANDSFIETHLQFSGQVISIGDFVLDEKNFPPKVIFFWRELYERALLGELVRTEYTAPARDKTFSIWRELTINPISSDEKITGLVCFAKDITQRKRDEIHLKISEERLKTIIETEPECVKVVDHAGKLLEMNQAGLKMLEASSLEEVKNRSLVSFILPEYKSDFIELHKKVIDGQNGKLEFEIEGINGTRRWLETNATPLFENNNTKPMLLGITRDITKRKQIEAKLIISNRLLQTISNINAELITTKTLEDSLSETVRLLVEGGNFQMAWIGWINERTQQVEPVAVYGDSFNYVSNIKVYADERPEGQGPIGIAIRKGEPIIVQDAMNDPRLSFWSAERKKTSWNSSVAVPIFINKKAKAVLVVYTDVLNYFGQLEISMLESIAANFQLITERNRAVVSLKENELRYRSLLANLDAGVVVHSTDTSIILNNPKAAELLGLSEDQLLGKLAIDPYWKFVNENGEMLDYKDYPVNRVLSTLSPLRNVILGVVFDTNIGVNWLLVNGVPVFYDQGDLKEIIISFSDISEIRKAEDQLKRLVEEKTVLLKEIHHRIKNNISNIEGLLFLQMKASDQPDVVEALQDAISRIKSVRVLYDKLLFSNEGEMVSIKAYLESLTDSIVGLFQNKENIKLEKNIIDFSIQSSRLFSIGLIINELITNSVKYAFSDKVNGELTISLTKEDRTAKLIVQDNGKGLPEGFNINESKGFGLMLVRMLSEQLKGRLSVSNNSGTRIELEFTIW